MEFFDILGAFLVLLATWIGSFLVGFLVEFIQNFFSWI